MTYRCEKHHRTILNDKFCPDCQMNNQRSRIFVPEKIVVEDIPDWFAAELKRMGDTMSSVAEESNRVSSGNGPGHVVNHAMVMLLRLVHMDDGSSAVAMLHSALDLAAEQWRQEQN